MVIESKSQVRPREAREKLKHLIQEKVLVTGADQPIISPSGESRAWLFDFRNILLKSEHLDLLTDVFWEECADRYPFQVGGLESAAIPLVAGIVLKGEQRGKPVNGFYIRKSRKKRDLMKVVEGEVTDDKIILVDDLINTGKSFTQQITILEARGKRVEHLFAFVHFGRQSTVDFFHEKGLPVTTIFTLSDFDLTYTEPSRSQQARPQALLVQWAFRSNDPNYHYVVPKSSPVLDAENVYFGADNGRMWALDQKTGEVRWSYQVGLGAKGKRIFSSPALHNERLFFGAYDGNVYCLDTSTGKSRWIFMDADWVGSSPALAPNLGLLFIGLEFGLIRKRGGIAALDLTTGAKVWEYSMPAYTHASPLYLTDRKQVVIGSNDGCAYLFDANSGALVWKFQTEGGRGYDDRRGFSSGDIKMSFAYDAKRDVLACCSLDGNAYVLERATGVPRHVIRVGATETTDKIGMYSTPLIHEGKMYITSLDKHVYCFALDTGALVWSHETGGRVFASPVIIQGALYVGANDGRLYELDPLTGAELSCMQFSERITNRVAYNEEKGLFFVLTFANELYCLTKDHGPPQSS